MEYWLIVGLCGVIVFFWRQVRKTKRLNADPNMQATASFMLECVRGYFSLTAVERQKRDDLLLAYLCELKSGGAGLKQLAHPVSMLVTVLTQDEREHLAKVTEYVHANDIAVLKPIARAPITGAEALMEKPYRVGPDGQISMSWTTDATLRTSETKDWVSWEIEDPIFETMQVIYARSGMNFDVGKAVRSIVWSNENYGLVILDGILGDDAGELGRIFPIPENFKYDSMNLNLWLRNSINVITNVP